MCIQAVKEDVDFSDNQRVKIDQKFITVICCLVVIQETSVYCFYSDEVTRNVCLSTARRIAAAAIVDVSSAPDSSLKSSF